MYRFRALLIGLAVFACIVPAAAHAANLPLFSPGWHIVPDAHDLDADCLHGAPLGFGGTLQLIQNAMNVMVSIGVLVTVLTIVFAGILWMLTATNPESHSQAKKVLTNAVMGLLILLSAWIIVDFVMKTLYDGDTAGFGPWNTILVGGDICVKPMTNTPLFSGNIFAQAGTGTGYDTSGGDSGATGPVGLGSGRCSPSSITSYAAAGGYTLTEAEAKTFSCIAEPESSCGANTSGATTPGGQPTTATGMFQVVLGLDDQCHNLNIKACNDVARQAGWTGTGNLNCSTAFSNGRPKAGKEELARICKAAATNLTCNVSAAACLLKMHPGFTDWTADSRSSKQKQCVANYNK